ncbi:MAG: universal stress protein, partial [Halobaculum sp.]
VHVVSVVDLSDVAASSSGSVATEVLDRLHDDAETAVERVAEQAAADGFETERTVLEGFPARDLLEYAADNDVDLITMGTHGRTGVSRFLLGSTAERVIRHATAPVLAVNTRELAAETEPRQ